MAELIVFEGLDGTGKTTQIQNVRAYLEAKGKKVYVTAEPTDGEIGRLLRKILSGEVKASPWQSAVLFLADRIGHCDRIKAHLDAGETVLCDRYYYSTLAYQGMDTDFDWLKAMHDSCPQILRPDKVLFLTMSPELCIHRIKTNRPNQALEIFETVEKLTKVKQQFETVFERLSDSENVTFIDASGTPEQVYQTVIKAIDG